MRPSIVSMIGTHRKLAPTSERGQRVVLGNSEEAIFTTPDNDLAGKAFQDERSAFMALHLACKHSLVRVGHGWLWNITFVLRAK